MMLWLLLLRVVFVCLKMIFAPKMRKKNLNEKVPIFRYLVLELNSIVVPYYLEPISIVVGVAEKKKRG